MSVVIISEHPFGAALLPLAQAVGPLYFSQGTVALQQAYDQVGFETSSCLLLKGSLSSFGPVF